MSADRNERRRRESGRSESDARGRRDESSHGSRDDEVRGRGHGGETGHDTSWSGPSTSTYAEGDEKRRHDEIRRRVTGARHVRNKLPTNRSDQG
jgi:hypothetical protein